MPYEDDVISKEDNEDREEFLNWLEEVTSNQYTASSDSELKKRLKVLCKTMDRIADKCSWNKLPSQCNFKEELFRKKYKMLVKEACAIEIELGL
jgi:hypothetical protein